MFFNINTGEVEDWTRRGLLDVSSRIIRTPLPPFQTFMDDPLRVLRTVRFACRLGFHIQSDIFAAGSHNDVREMLAHKISRERISKELLGMMKGDRPALAIHYLREMGLFEPIFQLPKTLGTKLSHRYLFWPVVTFFSASQWEIWMDSPRLERTRLDRFSGF